MMAGGGGASFGSSSTLSSLPSGAELLAPSNRRGDVAIDQMMLENGGDGKTGRRDVCDLNA